MLQDIPADCDAPGTTNYSNERSCQAVRPPIPDSMATVSQSARAGEIDVRNVTHDGQLVAVFMAIDQGDAFTVVTEVFPRDGAAGGTVCRRPYTFPNPETGLAFLNEAVTSFTYLGCEVHRQ